jgi:hypothetical protein
MLRGGAVAAAERLCGFGIGLFRHILSFVVSGVVQLAGKPQRKQRIALVLHPLALVDLTGSVSREQIVEIVAHEAINTM